MKIKDCIYIGVIILMLFGFLFVWKWDSENQLTNQISLITSWISISLAFLAIIYAFYQTWSSQKENQQMADSIKTLSLETQKIIDTREVIESINTNVSNVEINTEKLQTAIRLIETRTSEIFENLNNTEILSLEEIKRILPNEISDEIIKELYNTINNNTDELVKVLKDEYKEEAENENLQETSNGYLVIEKYIKSMEKGYEFKPKDIFEHFLSENINLSNGQVAGALMRLKNSGVIENYIRGGYRKK